MNLNGEIADAIRVGFEKRISVIVAYVDAEHRPHVSFRGSTHVQSSDEIAMWIRDPSGGLLAAIPDNPNVALMFRDRETSTNVQIRGRAYVERDPAKKRAIYDASPEAERNMDPEAKGEAVVVDVDFVTGRVGGKPLRMEKA